MSDGIEAYSEAIGAQLRRGILNPTTNRPSDLAQLVRAFESLLNEGIVVEPDALRGVVRASEVFSKTDRREAYADDVVLIYRTLLARRERLPGGG